MLQSSDSLFHCGKVSEEKRIRQEEIGCGSYSEESSMGKMLSQEEVSLAVQGQIIECLNRFYAIETGMWGGPLDALIVRTVVVGAIQNKPYDFSALATVLDLPIATVHRKVRNLTKTGVLVQEKAGRSTYLHPTSRTRLELDKSFEEMVHTLRRLYCDPDSIWRNQN